MRDRQPGKSLRRHWPKIRIWHLALAVLVTALCLGAIRLFAADSRVLEPCYPLIPFLFAMFFLLLSIHLGVQLGSRATRGLRQWGSRRGGISGCFLRSIAYLTQFGIVLVAVILVPLLFVFGIASLVDGGTFGWEGMMIRIRIE